MDDLDGVLAARQEHQRFMRKCSVTLCWTWVGLSAISCALLPVRNVLVGWGLDPILWAGPALVGLFALFVAAYCFYDGRPIPNEPLRAPIAPNLVIDQPWRAATKLRFLERLKEATTKTERQIQSAHTSALNAYHQIPAVVTYSAYSEAKSDLGKNENEKRMLMKALEPLYERIGKIFSGDVGSEILNIEERIKKLHRENQEHEREIAEQQAKADRCAAPKPCEKCDQWAGRKQDLRGYIHYNDVKVIELETDLKELQNFDFRQLWNQLNLPGPEDLSRVPHDRIVDMKTKIETLNSIPTLKNRGPQPSPEEAKKQKRNAAEKRIEEIATEYRRRIDAAPDEITRRRLANDRQAKIRELEEEWSRNL